jgi:dinuclear metal center YbgI/SA1388 family protein
MADVRAIAQFIEAFAPTHLAEAWDNVGLLVGDPNARVARLMTCLTITAASLDEAIARKAELIVTHHPFPFHAVKRITTETSDGRLLLKLTRAGISVLSPHTAFDSAARGINWQLAEGLGLEDIRPLVVSADIEGGDALGSGRFGRLPQPEPLKQFAERVKRFLSLESLQLVGSADRSVSQVAIACGSGGEFLSAARAAGCDCLVLGETRFHTCLEAEAIDVALVLAGHYATERFAVETLAMLLAEQFPKLEIWASQTERDPLRWH